MDSCLASVDSSGLYHYRYLPPCIYNSSNIQLDKSCQELSSCNDQILTYGMNYYGNNNTDFALMGIAKDGHLIYGPYTPNKNVITC